MPAIVSSGRELGYLKPVLFEGIAPFSLEQEKAVSAFIEALKDCGWNVFGKGEHCSVNEYIDMENKSRSWPYTLDRFCKSSDEGLFDGNDIFVYICNETDGYPIAPFLFGNFGEYDEPAFAELLLSGNEITAFRIGCGYDIKKSKECAVETISPESAIKTAMKYCYEALNSYYTSVSHRETRLHQLSGITLDYASFWKEQNPQFSLNVADISPAYWANGKILSPCWQVNLKCESTISDENSISVEERRLYVEDVYPQRVFVDALTGEILQWTTN